MNRLKQSGFASLILIFLSMVVMLGVVAVYFDYLDLSLDRIGFTPDAETPEEKVLVKKVVELRLEDQKISQVETVRVGVVPVEVIGYRITLMGTDYETYVTVLVENIPREVYETVTVGEGDARVVGDLIISLVKFVEESGVLRQDQDG